MLVIKIENIQWNRVAKRPATCCSLYELCFSASNYSFANKVDILHEIQKKAVDLKLQHRISKRNSFSRYFENAKPQNVLMSQYLYGSTSVVQKCFLKMLFLEVSQN